MTDEKEPDSISGEMKTLEKDVELMFKRMKKPPWMIDENSTPGEVLEFRAVTMELELSDEVYELLNFLCEETDIEFDSMCSQLVDEGLHKLMDNHEEFGKLMSSSLKMNFSLHDWLRKDEW